MPSWEYDVRVRFRIYKMRVRRMGYAIRRKARMFWYKHKPFKGSFAYEWQIGQYIFNWKHDDSITYRQGTHVGNFRVMTDRHWRHRHWRRR